MGLSRILMALVSLYAVTAIFVTGQDSDDQNTRQLRLWLTMKRSLEQPDGEKYFESNLKDALIPGGTNGLHSLMGTVVSSEPVAAPSKLVLALSAQTPEVTLHLVDGHGRLTTLNRSVAIGAKVAFAGGSTTFTKAPFMLTFEVELGRQGRFTILGEGRARSGAK